MGTKIKLRPYQDEAVREIRVEFRTHKAVLFVLPCGGGKTFTFSYIADSASSKGRNVIILVHRKELLLQASGSLTSLIIQHGMISPHFTPSPLDKVQVASVDTLINRVKKRKYKCDLLIIDEAHHVTENNKWGTVYEALGKPPVLGVTATPIRSDGIGLGVTAGGIFEVMVEGPSISQLIAEGHLVPAKVYGTLEQPDMTGVRKNKDGDWNQKQLAERTNKPSITGDAVAHFKRICPGARAIVYCTNIKHAKDVVAEFNAAGFCFALLVGAPEMSDAERTEVNRGMRTGKYQGAVTVDLVSEGYDLPELECCIMLRKTESEGLFIQQALRPGRPAPGKKFFYLLDHVGNVGSVIDGEFVVKHGLPDMDREWSLEGRPKKSRGESEPEKQYRQCPKCYDVHIAKGLLCPGTLPSGEPCDHEFRPGARKIEAGDGELQQITEEMAEQIRQQARREQGQADSVAALMALGHSQRRAEKIIEARREKDALREELISLSRDWTNLTGKMPVHQFGFTMHDIRVVMKPKALKEAIENLRTAIAAMKESAPEQLGIAV